MRAIIPLAIALIVGGCETTYKEVPTITSAESGSAARFAHGWALLMSEGPSGTVWLKPIRYYKGDKIFFEVVAFNHTARPINFGIEDIQVKTADGAPIQTYDFDHLRHAARQAAQRELMAATVVDGIELWHAARVSRRNPEAGVRIWRTAQDNYFATSEAIEFELEDAIWRYAQLTLETTTVDPYTTFGGIVFARQIDIPSKGTRELLVNVRFAGDDHRFRMRIAAEGTPTPIQTGLPAVARDQIEGVRQSCSTWMWNDPALPCHSQGTQP